MQGVEDDAGLAGKVALISGGGAAGDGIGNGRAAAILLARAGTKVMVADHELRLAQRTVEMIVAEGGTADETVVYQTGTLYGEWPDGRPFEGNRYVDRYVLRRGKIVRMEVWNDSAEWLLVRGGLAKP